MNKVSELTKSETATAVETTIETLPPTKVPADIDELAAFALPPGQEAVVVTEKLITQVPCGGLGGNNGSARLPTWKHGGRGPCSNSRKTARCIS